MCLALSTHEYDSHHQGNTPKTGFAYSNLKSQFQTSTIAITDRVIRKTPKRNAPRQMPERYEACPNPVGSTIAEQEQKAINSPQSVDNNHAKRRHWRCSRSR